MNWANQIKTILNNTGMSNLCNNQSVVDINYSSIKQRILDIYKQTWYAKINKLQSTPHVVYLNMIS